VRRRTKTSWNVEGGVWRDCEETFYIF